MPKMGKLGEIISPEKLHTLSEEVNLHGTRKPVCRA
jgi:hypothetical protein